MIDAFVEGVKILSIDGAAPLDAGYPSAGTVALIYKQSDKTGVVAEFIAFALSAEGQEAVRKSMSGGAAN